MLRLGRSDGSELSFELRAGFGVFDSWSVLSPQSTGLMVRVANNSDPTDTGLLDMVPATSTLGDAPLVPGTVLRDQLSGYYFKIDPFTGGAATLLASRQADFGDVVARDPGGGEAGPPGGGDQDGPGDPGFPADDGIPGGDGGGTALPPQPPVVDTPAPGPADSGGGSLPVPESPYVPPAPAPADGRAGVRAAAAVSLSSPRLRRGTAKLPANRRLRFAARGAGRLVITAGRRRVETRSATASFRLTKHQARRSTVRVVASRGALKRPLRLQLKVRAGRVTVTGGARTG